MRRLFFFVKPHPPAAIMHRACPVPENYRYDWEPVGLQYLAWEARRRNPGADVFVWHLMDRADDRAFLAAVRNERPAAVLFTEIDVLVNEADRLARAVKRIDRSIVTAVGGKQSSLLRPGDRLPFRAIDRVVGGPGADAAAAIVRSILSGGPVRHEALLDFDARTGLVRGAGAGSGADELVDLDPEFRNLPVRNHSFEEYRARRQVQPNLAADAAGTAPVLFGTGCPYACVFCQTPAEAGGDNAGYLLRDPARLAREIKLLKERRGVTNLFSLESNMHLGHLRQIYDELERIGIDSFPVSGFIRTSDLLAAGRNGLLADLARRGLRFVHCGIDVLPGSGRDAYAKRDSPDAVERCLELCLEHGVVVIGTYIGNPASTADGFRAELDWVAGLKLAEVDIRLAIALRNTEYFREHERFLIRHPDRHRGYFDRQNYRYQTLRLPGRIRPRQTYSLVRKFHRDFHRSPEHLAYVHEMIRRHPDTRTWFAARYRALGLADILGPAAG